MQRISAIAITLLLLPLAGCDMAAFAAGSTIAVFDRAQGSLPRYRDPDLAEVGIQASITQFEGVLMVKPEEPKLRLMLCRAYASFAFGFMVDHMEHAERAEQDEAAEHFRHRASISFLRARVIGLEQMNLWHREDGGVEGHEHAGVDSWKAYLRRFDNRDQVGILFWTAYSWIQYIGINKDDMDAVADLPLATALAERAAELDPTYYMNAPQALLAGLHGSTSEQMGGHPQQAKEEFDRVIAATQRHNFMYLVMEAKIVAVALQDRHMYRTLLEEVLNGDVNVDPDQRLSNVLAQRRAARYIEQIDDLFEPDPNDHPTDENVPEDAREDDDPHAQAPTPAPAPAAPAPAPAAPEAAVTPAPAAPAAPAAAHPAHPARPARPAGGAAPAPTH